jgi:PAS domain S-box-containing protein
MRDVTEPATMRILNVDGDKPNRYASSRLLRMAGYDVIEAASAQEALRLAVTESPDLVILDVNLPDLHGFETCCRLKADPATRDIPIMHLSATAVETHDVAGGLEGGADAYLVQPADPAVFLATVKALLRVRQAEKERQRLAQEAGRHRQLLQSILDNAPEAIVVADRDARIVMANDAAERLYARPIPFGQDFESHAAFQILHADGAPCVPRDLPLTRSALDGEAVSDREMAIIWPDRQRRDLLINTAPIRDAQGSITGAVGVFQDITERKESREALAQAYQRLQWLLASLPVGVAIAQDPECRLITFNPAGAALFEAEIGENVTISSVEPGRRSHQHLHNGRPLAPHELPLQRAVAEDREIHDIEIEVVASDGQRRDCRIDAAPVRDLNGVVVGGIAVMADITAQKRLLQVERERAQDARLLDTIVENTDNQLAYLDRDFNFVRVNGAYARGCGRAPEQLVGRNHFELFPNAENEAIFKRVRDTGKLARYHEKPFEYPNWPERGVTYWDWTLAPIKDEKGEAEGLVLALTDVTAQVKAREAMLAEERTRAQMAETVAAEISHRMKNNLAIAAGLLQMQVADQPPESAAAKIVDDAVARIRAFAVVHEQMYATHADEIELVSTLKRLAEVACEALGAADIEVSVAGKPLTVPSRNATSLAIMASELLTNAVKYGGPDQDGLRRIKIRIGTTNGQLRLTVWNSGNPVNTRFDPSRVTTMGLRLVQEVALTQFQGSFTIRRRNHGTFAQIMIDQDKVQGEA